MDDDNESTSNEDYAAELIMSPDHHRHLMMIPAAASPFQHDDVEYAYNYSCDQSNINKNPMMMFGAATQELGSDHHHMIKASIASHPSFPKLLDAYIDCQKVGAPPEIACLLEEIRRQRPQNDAVSVTVTGVDPQLDHFMETYCDLLVKYKTDLSRPFDEATTFLNNIRSQLTNLSQDVDLDTSDSKSYDKRPTVVFLSTHSNRSKFLNQLDDGGLSSDEEFSIGETMEMQESQSTSDDGEVKKELLRRYGGHIGSLKQEFSKKKKKGKLPKEARQTLLQWWNVHFRWPYPTEADKISLAETTGLDQKQINNWFINQRKRHWKPTGNMHLTLMDSLSQQFLPED